AHFVRCQQLHQRAAHDDAHRIGRADDEQCQDGKRGRVSAVNSLFIGTSNQLGEFESGMMAAALGPVAKGFVGGLGKIVVVLLWMRLFPDLTKVKT
ncbi:hypothetical protein ACCS64_37655, partial [Rhizobium ruizarguesonis]